MDSEITSKENPYFKELKKISLGKNDSYVFIEGKKLFLEAINSSLEVKKIFTGRKNKNLLSKLSSSKNSFEIIFIKDELLASVFTTDNKPATNDLIIALAKKTNWQPSDLFSSQKKLIFLERIQDPGNLGTIIRSCLAFNSGGVILTKDSANPYNTKVIRASAGAVFKLPIVLVDGFKVIEKVAKEKKYTIVATSVNAGTQLNNLKLDDKRIFLFGNEGSGLSKELINIADEIITIPHSKKAESLNLGIAVSILLWEQYKNKNG